MQTDHPLDAHAQTRLRQLDRDVVWHGFTQMAEYDPLVIERGEGNWLYEIDGRRLFDGVSSLWCNVHGHQHPQISQAIREQLDRVAHVTSLGMSNIPAIELAQRLVGIAPASLQHVFYSCDGSSAVEAALKIAFQYARLRFGPNSKKSRFVALGLAYHGDTLGGVSVGGVEAFHKLFSPLLFDALRAPCPQLYRLPDGVAAEQACEYYLEAMDRLLTENQDQVIGVVMEPLVQGAAGMIVHPEGYLRGVRELTKRHDVLLICDEVATGFGRTGKMFACQHEDVSPDILCVAKGLTGGYLPMAATLVCDPVYQQFLGRIADFRQFFHGHTYAGNPLAAAAALASLDIFSDENTLDNVNQRSQQLTNRLASIAASPIVGDIRQRGLMVGIELVQDQATKAPFPTAQLVGRRFCQAAIERGVWLRPLGDVIVLMPPLSTTADELDFVLDVIAECCAAMTQQFLPTATSRTVVSSTIGGSQ